MGRGSIQAKNGEVKYRIFLSVTSQHPGEKAFTKSDSLTSEGECI